MQPMMEVPNNPVLNINSLPQEILIKVFGYLTQNQLGQIARVCRNWNVLTKSPILWKKVSVELYSHHESQSTVAIYFVSTLPSCATHIRLEFKSLPYWTDLLNFEELCIKLQEKCPHLKVLFLRAAELSDNLLSATELCTQFLNKVEVLVFRFCIFPDCPAKDLCFDVSKIEVLDVNCCYFGSFIKPSFSKMANLKKLRLANTDIDDTWFEDDLSYLNQLHVLDVGYTRISSRTFFELRNHAVNLRELYLCWIALQENDLQFNNLVFPHLSRICLRYCNGVGVICEAVVSLIRSCQHLKDIYVSLNVALSCAKKPFFLANGNKSIIIKVIECDKHQKVNYLCE